MAGSHRERSQRPLQQRAQKAYSLVDGGNTPMLHPPLSLQQESAMRSTLARPGESDDRKDSVFDRPPTCAGHEAESREHKHLEHHRAVSPPRHYPTISFTPINKPRPAAHILATTSDVFAQRYNRHIPELNIDYYDVDQHQLGSVDREDGRTYHFGHIAGQTYSGTFVEERAIPLETLAHIDKKLDEQSAALRVAEGTRREREVRALLETGSSLVLHKTPDVEDHEIICALKGCLSRAEYIPPATYWVAFQQLGAFGPWQQETSFRLCLKCLEWIWQGHDYSDKPPHAGVTLATEVGVVPADLMYEKEYSPLSPGSDVSIEQAAFSLDGTAGTPPTCDAPARGMTNTRITHEHTVSELDESYDYPLTPTAGHSQSPRSQLSGYGSPVQEFGETPPPIESPVQSTQRWKSPCTSRRVSTPEPIANEAVAAEAEDSPKSPCSINADGEWRHPPTRFQHIAAFIKPGSGLSTEEKAAVWLWKAASQEQLKWEVHLRKTAVNRNYYAGRRDDNISAKLREFKIDSGENEDETVAYWEQLTGLRKEDCRGNNLSEILHQTSRRRAGKDGVA